MNKLITSLACGTVLSMSIMGASYASSPTGTAALGGIPEVTTATMDGNMDGNMGNARMMNNNGNWMNGTTGTMNKNESIMKDKIRTNDNYRPNGYSTNNYNQRNNDWDNYTNGYMWDNTNTNTNNKVSPMAGITPAGRYRATSTTVNNTGTTNRGSNWGWLGLFGLLGLVGMRSRGGERN